MTTPQEFIAAAAKWVGTTENPPGSNRQPFAPLAGHAQGHPWCASFVVAVARSVGLRLPSESAYTPTMFNGFAATGSGFRPGKGVPITPGSIVFFDFPDSVHRIQHVGICTGVSANYVTCIEGNTSPGVNGSQDNGGGVYLRTRPIAHVAGFGRPNFKEPVVPESPPPTYSAKAQLVAFQAIVNPETGKLGYYMVTADGEVFGFGVPFLGRIDTQAIS